jgi:hypothetical protein
MNDLKEAMYQVIRNMRSELNEKLNAEHVAKRLTSQPVTPIIQCYCGHEFFVIPTYARYDGNAWRWQCDPLRDLRGEFERTCKLGLYFPYVR